MVQSIRWTPRSPAPAATGSLANKSRSDQSTHNHHTNVAAVHSLHCTIALLIIFKVRIRVNSARHAAVLLLPKKSAAAAGLVYNINLLAESYSCSITTTDIRIRTFPPSPPLLLCVADLIDSGPKCYASSVGLWFSDNFFSAPTSHLISCFLAVVCLGWWF